MLSAGWGPGQVFPGCFCRLCRKVVSCTWYLKANLTCIHREINPNGNMETALERFCVLYPRCSIFLHWLCSLFPGSAFHSFSSACIRSRIRRVRDLLVRSVVQHTSSDSTMLCLFPSPSVIGMLMFFQPVIKTIQCRGQLLSRVILKFLGCSQFWKNLPFCIRREGHFQAIPC